MTMRIHGKYIIIRRLDVEKKTYEHYREELREDFHCICGYCGKSEVVTKKGFEIDHFVPKTVDVSLKDEYQNLVYSCFTCNRKKGKKWPTGNSHLQNDGKIGLVDPATEEYDNHLMRDETGKIIPKTMLGEYLCNNVFKFQCRPTDVVWKAMKMVELEQQLEAKESTLSPEEKDKYIKTNKVLRKLMSYLFDYKE